MLEGVRVEDGIHVRQKHVEPGGALGVGFRQPFWNFEGVVALL